MKVSISAAICCAVAWPLQASPAAVGRLVPLNPSLAGASALAASGKETVVHSFGGSDGAGPTTGLVAGKHGTFTARRRFRRHRRRHRLRANSEWIGIYGRVLYSFKGGYDGSVPEGVVFATLPRLRHSFVGGSPNSNGGIGWGTVFELTPGKSGYWKPCSIAFVEARTHGNPTAQSPLTRLDLSMALRDLADRKMMAPCSD